MEWKDKVVAKLPAEELWSADGPIQAKRLRSVDMKMLTQILRVSSVRFVILNVGLKPQWFAEEECYEIWQSEVKPHLRCDNSVVDSSEDEYCYFASEWSDEAERPIIVLEMVH